MEVGGALASVLLGAFSLPCLLLLLVLGEAGLRVAALTLRGGEGRGRGRGGGHAWPTRSALLGYRIARPGGDGLAYPPAFRDDEEPPLPPECCDRLALSVYRRGREQGPGPDPDCAFCLSAVRDGEEVRELRCRHVFHRACLDAWLVRPRATCPLCRDRLLPADLPSPSAAAEDAVDDDYYGGFDDDDGALLSSSSSSSSAGAPLWQQQHMT